MSRIVDTISDSLGPVIGIAFVAATFFGIYHAFQKHSSASGFVSVFVPPYAWYMSAEALLWHDDFTGVDWEKRLRNDIKLTVALIGAAAKVPEEKQQEYNNAVEEFSKTVRDYPPEKKDYLESFGTLYLRFSESATEDVLQSFELALKSGEILVFNESPETRELEEQILQYDGADELIADYKLALFALDEVFEGKDPKKFSSEKQEQMLAFMRLANQQNINRMENAFAMIFE